MQRGKDLLNHYQMLLNGCALFEWSQFCGGRRCRPWKQVALFSSELPLRFCFFCLCDPVLTQSRTYLGSVIPTTYYLMASVTEMGSIRNFPVFMLGQIKRPRVFSPAALGLANWADLLQE